MKQKILMLTIGLAIGPVFSASPPMAPVVTPELHLNTAEPALPNNLREGKEWVPTTETVQTKIIEVDEEALLANPELLERVMYSAIVGQNLAGIKASLPIYEKLPTQDPMLLAYARAIVARADGRAADSVAYYRQVIAQQPDALAVRMQLAQALFENSENEAANDQFNKLQAENLPDEVREVVKGYQEALLKRDSWSFYAGVNILREKNINQAPKERRLGGYLSEEECSQAQAANPNDDCYRGWTFNEPIDALGINYQFGSSKKWSWQRGYYGKLDVDGYGKYYPSETDYNDMTLRVAPAVGYADQRDEVGVSPFHERRLYGNKAYSYTNGARVYWNRWWTPALQSLSAFEYGNVNNTQRSRSDNTNQLASGSLLYYASARQYWLAGVDLYREGNPDDDSDSFNRYNSRIAWGQEWPKGISSRVQLNYARRYYRAPTMFSDGANRRDKEWGARVSLWHRSVHFGGMTPRLTFSRNSIGSNDEYYEHNKNRLYLELNKTF